MKRITWSRRIVHPILWGSFLLYAILAHSQIREVAAAGDVTEKLQHSTLAEGALYVCGLAITAMSYMARLLYQALREQTRTLAHLAGVRLEEASHGTD